MCDFLRNNWNINNNKIAILYAIKFKYLVVMKINTKESFQVHKKCDFIHNTVYCRTSIYVLLITLSHSHFREKLCRHEDICITGWAQFHIKSIEASVDIHYYMLTKVHCVFAKQLMFLKELQNIQITQSLLITCIPQGDPIVLLKRVPGRFEKKNTETTVIFRLKLITSENILVCFPN